MNLAKLFSKTAARPTGKPLTDAPSAVPALNERSHETFIQSAREKLAAKFAPAYKVHFELLREKDAEIETLRAEKAALDLEIARKEREVGTMEELNARLANFQKEKEKNDLRVIDICESLGFPVSGSLAPAAASGPQTSQETNLAAFVRCGITCPRKA